MIQNKKLYYYTCLSIIISCIVILPLKASENDFNEEDPLKGYNKTVTDINFTIDKYLLRPLASAYSWAVPPFLRSRVSDFFSNLSEFPNASNHLLQGEIDPSVTSVSRFLTNTSIGGLGFFDVASELGIPSEKTDLGETLYQYGFSSGPYVVLPFFGGASLRDHIGRQFDSALFSIGRDSDYYTAGRVLNVISIRSEFLAVDRLLPRDPEARYSFTKNLYYQNRSRFLGIENKKEKEDPFNDFFPDD